jgi:hypothetical protein
VKRGLPAIAGALFGVGACLSGMVRPSKVLGFLDFGGAWDATLLFVMAAALLLHVVVWRVVASRPTPPFGAAYPDPPSRRIDLRLVGGAAMFGAGWGLAGFCPGPALVSLAGLATSTFVFVGAMAAAMWLTGARADRAPAPD